MSGVRCQQGERRSRRSLGKAGTRGCHGPPQPRSAATEKGAADGVPNLARPASQCAGSECHCRGRRHHSSRDRPRGRPRQGIDPMQAAAPSMAEPAIGVRVARGAPRELNLRHGSNQRDETADAIDARLVRRKLPSRCRVETAQSKSSAIVPSQLRPNMPIPAPRSGRGRGV